MPLILFIILHLRPLSTTVLFIYRLLDKYCVAYLLLAPLFQQNLSLNNTCVYKTRDKLRALLLTNSFYLLR